MRFSTTLFLTASLLSGAGVFAAPVPAPVNLSLGLKSARSSSVSVVSLIEKAQSRVDQVLVQTGKSLYNSKISTLDPTTLNNIISTANDVSNTLATDLQTLDPNLDTLMVDATGNKLTNEELAAKVATLLKTFTVACLTAKDTGSGEIANIIELIALNIDDMSDGLRLIVPEVTGIRILTDEFKITETSISQLVDGVLGPDS